MRDHSDPRRGRLEIDVMNVRIAHLNWTSFSYGGLINQEFYGRAVVVASRTGLV